MSRSFPCFGSAGRRVPGTFPLRMKLVLASLAAFVLLYVVLIGVGTLAEARGPGIWFAAIFVVALVVAIRWFVGSRQAKAGKDPEEPG